MRFTSAEKKQSLTYRLHVRKASAWFFLPVFIPCSSSPWRRPWGSGGMALGHRGWGDAQGAQDSVPPHAAPTPPNTHLHEPPDSSCQEQRLSTNPQLTGSQAGEFWLSWASAPFRGCILAREGQKKLLELPEMPTPRYGRQDLLLSPSAAGNLISTSQAAFLVVGIRELVDKMEPGQTFSWR